MKKISPVHIGGWWLNESSVRCPKFKAAGKVWAKQWLGD
jgi:hypothetical protein